MRTNVQHSEPPRGDETASSGAPPSAPAPQLLGGPVGGRRRQILDALTAELATDRLANLGVEGIAARAGISRTRFYHYFTSKYGAFGTLLDGISAELLEEYRNPGSWFVRNPADRPKTAMEQTFMRVFELWDRRMVVLREASDLWNLPPEVRIHWEQFMERIVDVTADAISREREIGIAPPGSDPKALATALLWQGERILFLKCSKSSAFDVIGTNEKLRDLAVEIWMRTIYGSDDPDPTA